MKIVPGNFFPAASANHDAIGPVRDDGLGGVTKLAFNDDGGLDLV